MVDTQYDAPRFYCCTRSRIFGSPADQLLVDCCFRRCSSGVGARSANDANLNQGAVRTVHRFFERLIALSGCPPKGERNRPAFEAGLLQPMRNHFGFGETRFEECDQELVATHSHYRLLGSHMTHQKTTHFHQHRIARRVTMRVVVLLEMVDVYVDASPGCICLPVGRVESRQMPSVIAPGEWIADALLEQLILESLAASDIDEDSVEDCFARLRIGIAVPRIEDRSDSSVGSRYPKLTISDRAFALKQSHLFLPDVCIDEVADSVVPQLFDGRNAENLEERGIGIEYLAFRRRDVNPLSEILGEARQSLRIAEAPESGIGFRYLLLAQDDFLACGMCIAL